MIFNVIYNKYLVTNNNLAYKEKSGVITIFNFFLNLMILLNNN